MKTIFTIAAIAAGFALLPDDMPTPKQYEPTDNPSQNVREFIQGDRATLDDADLYAPSVSESIRKAAQQLID